MKAIWLVRSRQLMTRIKFWIAIVGYDPNDRSISQKFYLVYAVIFFSIWWLVVFILLSDQLAVFLSLMKLASPERDAIIFLAILLLGDVFYHCYRYAKRSPFVFSDEDATLICLTPVDRRQVAMAWVLGEWIPAGLPYWAAAVILSLCLWQLSQTTRIVWTQFPFYVLSAFRAVSIMLPLQLALMSATYIFGALRLRRDKDLPYLRFFPLVIGAGMLLLIKFDPAFLNTILWPLLFPLAAGFGQAGWLSGFILSVTWLIISLLALYFATPAINLSRAAQESQIHG